MPEFFQADPDYPGRPLPVEHNHDNKQDDTFVAIVNEALSVLRGYTDELGEGVVSVTDWEDDYASGLALYHTAAYLIGQDVSTVIPDDEKSGEVEGDGREELTDAIASQYAYLRNFADVLRDDPGPYLSALYRARADMYGRSVGESWWLGWSGDFILPVYPRQRSACMTNCCCSWRSGAVDYKTGNAEFFWELAPCDHCEQCPKRNEVFFPYRFRNFIGDPFDPSGIFLSSEEPYKEALKYHLSCLRHSPYFTPERATAVLEKIEPESRRVLSQLTSGNFLLDPRCRLSRSLYTYAVGALQELSGNLLEREIVPMEIALKALPQPLTDREIEVAKLVKSGNTNRTIANRLCITVGTAKIHVSRVLAKLECENRTQAAIRLAELGE